MLADSLRRYEVNADSGIYIEDYGDAPRTSERYVAVPQQLFGIPVYLAASPYGDHAADNRRLEWFNHYNPHLIDMMTEQLDNPVIAALVSSLGEHVTITQNIVPGSDMLVSFTRSLLDNYREVESNGGFAAAVGLYGDYIRDPFTADILTRFRNYSNPAAASFWTRRTIDGSADAFHRLLTRLDALFPESGDDEDGASEEEYE